MVPVLSLILPYSHLEAIATSLATITLVASFNTYFFNKQKVIVWQIVPWIALTSSLFSFVSAKVSQYLAQDILVIIFLIFLTWVAVRTFLITEKTHKANYNYDNKILPLGIGSLSGTTAGFTGIGGGGITTPLMLITGLVKNVQAAPTSNAIMIFTAFFASISFALADNTMTTSMTMGYIHYDTSLLLFLGSATFSKFGVKINNLFPLFWRKTVLGTILIFVSIRLLFMLII